MNRQQKLKILVSVGTHEQSFQRLIDAVLDIIRSGSVEAEWVVQYGNATWPDTPRVPAYRFLDSKAFNSLLSESDVLISQASPGNCFGALENNCFPIVMGRRSEDNEHVDNHQIDFASELQSLGLATPFTSSADLQCSLAAVAANRQVYQDVCSQFASQTSTRRQAFRDAFWATVSTESTKQKRAARKMKQIQRLLRLLKFIPTALKYWLQNLLVSDSIVGDGSVVVNITTHGHRLSSAFFTLESIARGIKRPDRIILWLNQDNELDPLPKTILRLQRRGLEVEYVKDYGPHTKYYPFVLNHLESKWGFVTADDDTLYPKDWLSDLLEAARSDNFQNIECHRAHEVGISDADALLPYAQWKPCGSTQPHLRNMATGVSGVFYPAHFAERLREEGDKFLTVAPRADDLWLHSVAVKYEVSTRQVQSAPGNFPTVPGTQIVGLHLENTVEGGNDKQLDGLYPVDRVRMMRSSTPGLSQSTPDE